MEEVHLLGTLNIGMINAYILWKDGQQPPACPSSHLLVEDMKVTMCLVHDTADDYAPSRAEHQMNQDLNYNGIETNGFPASFLNYETRISNWRACQYARHDILE